MTTILDVADVEFDLETQCVVVGAGACGLIAALALADAQIDTLVLERDTQASGSTSLSSGFIPAVGTRVQRQQGIDDSLALFAADIQHKANQEADQQIVDAVVRKSGPALDWLESRHGIAWVLLNDFLYPGHSAHRMHAVPGKTGAAFHSQLLAAANDAGVDIVTSARVDALVVANTMRSGLSDASAVVEVCGVRIIRPDGEYETIKASAVILACNGYGGNTDLMRRFIPEMAHANYCGHAGNTGDAIVWGEMLGAPLRHTSAYQGHGSVAVGHNILITWALMMEGGVQINSEGNRFSNEHAGYSEQAVKVIRQPGECVWNIYDQRLHETGLAFPDYQAAFDGGAVIMADDIAALSVATKMPLVPLHKTLEHVDQLASSESTDEFGRQFRSSTRLKAPYCAVKVGPALFHTQGGLTINTNAQVIGDDLRPIKNLMAAGGAACGVSGSTVAGYLSGNGLLTAVTLGLIAAESAIGLVAKK
jgi:fumarate reductase flavoprotein subunit